METGNSNFSHFFNSRFSISQRFAKNKSPSVQQPEEVGKKNKKV